MLYRYAEVTDLPAAADKLQALAVYAEKYPFVHTVSLTKAQKSVEHAVLTHRAFVVDNCYLVLVDVFSPWYTEDAVLQEWFVLKLYDEGDVNKVPVALQAIAHDLGINIIVTSDSSPVQIMARAYTDAGFCKLTQSFCTKV